MKRLLALTAIGACLWLQPTPSHCATCLDMFCISSSDCFQGCACARDLTDASGVCVAVR